MPLKAIRPAAFRMAKEKAGLKVSKKAAEKLDALIEQELQALFVLAAAHAIKQKRKTIFAENIATAAQDYRFSFLVELFAQLQSKTNQAIEEIGKEVRAKYDARGNLPKDCNQAP